MAFPVHTLRDRVAVYITDVLGRLLVFEHRDFPDAGVQVPGGRHEPGETAAEAARREAWEETGLACPGDAAFLGERTFEWPGSDGVNRQRSTAWHLTAPAGAPEAWLHVVTAGEEDGGLVFLCRFQPLEAVEREARMTDYHKTWLPELRGRLNAPGRTAGAEERA
ncbi:MAG TPA: NUDIX domain-containing protein [Deinococcales bacterium]|nr:NUDIX domain-containing protein [Deinococcales bacterium]